MVTIGVLVRFEGELVDVEERLRGLAGVETLSLEESQTLGALIHTETLEQAHTKLVCEMQSVEGVLCAWPVHTDRVAQRSAVGCV